MYKIANIKVDRAGLIMLNSPETSIIIPIISQKNGIKINAAKQYFRAEMRFLPNEYIGSINKFFCEFRLDIHEKL